MVRDAALVPLNGRRLVTHPTSNAMLTVVPAIPPASLLFIFGVERLLKCRPLANIIGNGVACVAVSAWMRQLDRTRLRAVLA